MALLILFNTENDWNQIKINITMTIFLSNSIIVFVVVIVFSIQIIVKWLIGRRNRKLNRRNDIQVITPLPSLNRVDHSQELANNESIRPILVINTTTLREENKHQENSSFENYLISHRKLDINT